MKEHIIIALYFLGGISLINMSIVIIFVKLHLSISTSKRIYHRKIEKLGYSDGLSYDFNDLSYNLVDISKKEKFVFKKGQSKLNLHKFETIIDLHQIKNDLFDEDLHKLCFLSSCKTKKFTKKCYCVQTKPPDQKTYRIVEFLGSGNDGFVLKIEGCNNVFAMKISLKNGENEIEKLSLISGEKNFYINNLVHSFKYGEFVILFLEFFDGIPLRNSFSTMDYDTASFKTSNFFKRNYFLAIVFRFNVFAQLPNLMARLFKREYFVQRIFS